MGRILSRKKKLDINEFRHKLVENIQKLSKTKQKVGLFLSGGLDSTTVLSDSKRYGFRLNGLHMWL